MWAKAAKAIAGFREGVITGLDASGYPVSVRQTSLPYDAKRGELPVIIPSALGMQAGAANLLCHAHDDKLWNLRAISVKGRLEQRGLTWVFVTTAYEPQSQLAMVGKMRRSMASYLAKRNLPVPQVDFDAVKRLWARAKQIQDP